MSRLFVVKKPCVIECKYFEAGSIYKPSYRMSDIALDALIRNHCLEEKDSLPHRKDAILESIKIMDDTITELQKLLFPLESLTLNRYFTIMRNQLENINEHTKEL